MPVDEAYVRVLLSAILGAGLYHVGDTVKTRVVLIGALKSELDTNRRLLEDEIRAIDERGDDCRGGLRRVFHGEAYNAVRTREPAIFLDLLEEDVNIVDTYQTLFQYNELQMNVLAPRSEGETVNRELLLWHMLQTHERLEVLLDRVNDRRICTR